MSADYRVTWCDDGRVRCVDGMTLDTAQRAFAAICKELRATLSWVHLIRMPDRTTYASMDRATMDAVDSLTQALRRAPMNVGGELNPEDQA